MKRGALVIVAIVVAGLAAMGVRVVVEGRRALAAGDEAAARGELRDAVQSWETAARWYLPLAPHVDAAYGRLEKIAREDRDRAHALMAWQAIRSAAIATRGAWQPHASDLAAANAAIPLLLAQDPEGAKSAGDTIAERTAFYRDRYERDPRPAPFAIALAALGILVWLGGLGWLVARGLDASGRLARRPALVGAALAVLGLAGWAAGLYSA